MKELDKLTKDSKEEWEEGISSMFTEISETYEKINTFISMGMDKGWRKKLMRRLESYLVNPNVLDIGCGPGSLSALAKTELPKAKFISSDISIGMLKIAANSGNCEHTIQLSASDLPFKDEKFGAVTSAFVLRNLPDLDRFYEECYRVLDKDGVVVMLDLTKPTFPGVALGHSLYMKAALPLGATIYGSRVDAYKYLDRSIHNCVDPDEMNAKLTKAGFTPLHTDRLCMGTVTIYTAKINK